MSRALSSYELAFLYERFITHAIQTFVFFLVDVACGFAAPPQLLRRLHVHWVGRADEMKLWIEVELLLQLFEFCGIFIHVGLRFLSHLKRFPVYLHSVLVGPSVEKDFIALKMPVSRENVRLHEFKRKSQMRLRIDVRKRGR